MKRLPRAGLLASSLPSLRQVAVAEVSQVAMETSRQDAAQINSPSEVLLLKGLGFYFFLKS